MRKLESKELSDLVKKLEKEGVSVMIENVQENIKKTIVAGCRGG